MSTQEQELNQQLRVSSEKIDDLGKRALELAKGCKEEKIKKYMSYALDELSSYLDAFSIELDSQGYNSDSYESMLNDVKAVIGDIEREKQLLKQAEIELEELKNGELEACLVLVASSDEGEEDENEIAQLCLDLRNRGEKR